MNFDKLSGYASILGLVFTIVSLLTKNNFIHLGLLGSTAIIFIILSIYSFKQYNNASRYLDGEAEIRILHNTLILENPKIKEKTFDGIILELSNICTQISEAFEKIKGQKLAFVLNM